MIKILTSSLAVGLLLLVSCHGQPNIKQIKTLPNAESYTKATGQYPVVDTRQSGFYNNDFTIHPPGPGEAFFGQDAGYRGNQPSYTLLTDEVVLDNQTQLQWQRGFEVLSYPEALEKLKSFHLGGHSDWRLPTIKEAYSLILFDGIDPSGLRENMNTPLQPFIDTAFFSFRYAANGDRMIDAQMLTSTIYTGLTMGGNQTVFGVNFADGRIKGYPLMDPWGPKKFMVRFVRGNPEYGKNNFEDRGDGTILDKATDLMWSKDDSQKGMNWEAALAWVQQMNAENYLGHSDWRLPNAKELQSIVDYNVSPQHDGKAAISSLFNTTAITVEDGSRNFPFYWTSTTHLNPYNRKFAVYVCFGDAFGYFAPPRSVQKKSLMDVHGAGAQRSDPKTGSPAAYPQGHGPQGDVIRINNFVRLVRQGD